MLWRALLLLQLLRLLSLQEQLRSERFRKQHHKERQLEK